MKDGPVMEGGHVMTILVQDEVIVIEIAMYREDLILLPYVGITLAVTATKIDAISYIWDVTAEA